MNTVIYWLIMLEGITAGFILSLALFPGTVWLAKVGVSGTKRQVCAVGLGFALSQMIWLSVSIPGLMMMSKHLSFLRFGMHLFAVFVLGYMAFKFFRTRRVEVLDDAGALPTSLVLFRNAFNRALAMPMRLPTAMAVLLATGVFVNYPPTWEVVPSVMIGGLIGVLWWWGQFTFLAAFFAKRVPERITIKSLNKIRPFCAVLFCCLSLIALLLAG
jgi:threonine/homoserine/homoserine lactone efflux protein